MDLANFPHLAMESIIGYFYPAYNETPDYISGIFSEDPWQGTFDYYAETQISGFGKPTHIPQGQRAPVDQVKETYMRYFRVVPYRESLHLRFDVG